MAETATTCELPGAPRITYLAYAFEIVQNARPWCVFHLDRTAQPAGLETSDGDSAAHWGGDTLVVDVSHPLRVTERYTPVDANTVWYEATIEDPKVFTRPWKLRLPLHRQAKNFELMEYSCDEGTGSAPAGKLSSSAQ